MFRLEHSAFLFLLLLIPAAIGLFYYFKKKQRAEWELLNQANNNTKDSDITENKKLKKFTYGSLPLLNWKSLVLWLIIGVLGIFTLANPQFNSDNKEVEIESTDVFLALDISHSMLANDLKPNRLTRAKNLGQQIIEGLEGNRVGLILFAGEAYMFMPLTSDISSAISFIQSANINMAPTQGTAIAASIDLAMNSFDPENETAKSIIIISDGEDHEQEIDDATERAKDENVYIFTVAIGTDQGSYLPGLGRDNYLFDDNGKPVRSVVNEAMLGQIAETTGASTFNLSKEKNIDEAIAKNISQMEKQVGSVAKFSSLDSYFQYLLFPVILLVLWQLLGGYFSSFITRKNQES